MIHYPIIDMEGYILMLDNILYLIGLVGSSYSFSKGVPAIGLLFVILMIIGLLTKPPKTETEPQEIE